MSEQQLPLFGFKEMLPSGKVPISREKIELAKKLIENRDSKNAIVVLRDLREGLERFERRLTNKK